MLNVEQEGQHCHYKCRLYLQGCMFYRFSDGEILTDGAVFSHLKYKQLE